ncbi:hypothetical protein [Alloprevotella tannerae]
MYAHERKPFLSRAQTFFIVSVSLFCRDKKGAPQMFAACDVHSEGDKIQFLDSRLATCGFCRARAEKEGESRSNTSARRSNKNKRIALLIKALMGDKMRLTDAVSGLFVDKQSIARRISSQEITIVSRHLIIIQLMHDQ